MLIEIWEFLHGYSRWNETEGVIESAEVRKEPVGERGILFITTSADTLVWNDLSGQKHSATFVLPEDSSLFPMKSGDKMTIRYNPDHPERFYLRDLFRTKVKAFFVQVLVWTCVAMIAIAYILYHLARIQFRRQLW